MGKSTISLDRLCGGALLERFRLAMESITRNIMDPNTDPEKNRTLTIKLTFKPSKSRTSIKTTIQTNVSLAPPLADETVLLAGRNIRTGAIEMMEHGNEDQMVRTQEAQLPVKAEVIPTAPPAEAFDPETGEIYQAQTQSRGPIDLRAANY